MSEEWLSPAQAVERTAAKLSLSIGLARGLLQREGWAAGVRLGGEEWQTRISLEQLLDTRSLVEKDRRRFVEVPRSFLENADIDWEAELIRNDDGEIIGNLRVNAEDLEAWLRERIPQHHLRRPQTETQKNKGGAPRKFDKQSFVLKAAQLLAQPDGVRPKNRQELSALMAEWWLKIYDEEPKAPTLRAYIAEIYKPSED